MNENIDPANMTVKAYGTDEPMPITVGMPATFRIGSDYYARTIAELHFYKSGAKAGQLKGVTDTKGITYKLNKFNYLKEEGCKYGSLSLGYAIDRLDPHF